MNFANFFKDQMLKKKIEAKKNKRLKAKKSSAEKLMRRDPGPMKVNPGYYNQANVIDTAHTSSQTFVPKG